MVMAMLVLLLHGLGAASSLSIQVPTLAHRTAGIHIEAPQAANLRIGSSWAEAAICAAAFSSGR